MVNNRISWVWMILLFLGFTFYILSASQARPISSHHPTAVVVGTILGDASYQQDQSKASHFISGGIVAVECANSGKSSRFYQEVKTNNHGEFSVHLPFLVDRHVENILGCSARLISSGGTHCVVALTTASSSFRLKSRKKGTQIFSAGFFTFKPVNNPRLCNKKPSIRSTNKKESYPDKSFVSTPNDPILSPSMSNFFTINHGFLPPLPGLPPLPQLPPLPPLSVFPPFFHPRPMSPPIIFHRPPVSPSIFLSPPVSPPSKSPPIIPPPVRGLTPLPPPTSQFHLPPFPFRPMRGFPGVPPASASSLDEKKSP